MIPKLKILLLILIIITGITGIDTFWFPASFYMNIQSNAIPTLYWISLAVFTLIASRSWEKGNSLKALCDKVLVGWFVLTGLVIILVHATGNASIQELPWMLLDWNRAIVLVAGVSLFETLRKR